MKCKICGETIVNKKEDIEYCSLKCFKVYLDSKEFDDELNKTLDIKTKNEKSNNI